MFFDDWSTLAEILVTTGVVYFALILILRITGKRTTSKMNSFDWIVTVALGSMVSTVILVDEVPLVEGILGIVALVLLQYLVALLASRFPRFQSIVKANPRLLFYDGEFNHDAMRHERITEAEILSIVRQQGYLSLENVQAIVMETNADLSILPTPDEEKDDQPGTLQNVEGFSS